MDPNSTLTKSGDDKNFPPEIISLEIFKGCPKQILLGPFLNTLTHLTHATADELFEGV